MFNYLADSVNAEMAKKKRKNLIIFDEGHNIIDQACEGSSFILNEIYLKRVSEQVEKILEQSNIFIKEI